LQAWKAEWRGITVAVKKIKTADNVDNKQVLAFVDELKLTLYVFALVGFTTDRKLGNLKCTTCMGICYEPLCLVMGMNSFPIVPADEIFLRIHAEWKFVSIFERSFQHSNVSEDQIHV